MARTIDAPSCRESPTSFQVVLVLFTKSKSLTDERAWCQDSYFLGGKNTMSGHQTHELAEYSHRHSQVMCGDSQQHCSICLCRGGPTVMILGDCSVLAPRGTRDCRSFVTPDRSPGSSLSRASRDRVRWNDDGRDAHPTGDCFGLAPSQCQFWPFILTISGSNGNYFRESARTNKSS